MLLLMQLKICLFEQFAIKISIGKPIYQFIRLFCIQSTFLSIQSSPNMAELKNVLFIYLSKHLFLSIFLSIYIYLSIYLPFNIYLYIYPSIYLSTYLSIYLSIYPSTYLSPLYLWSQVFCEKVIIGSFEVG